MRTRPLCVAAALVCLSWPAAAQTVLTEAEALARLSADSPRVRIIRVGVEVARAETLSAGRWPNPRVTFNREAVAGVSENMLLITQSLPISGRRALEIDAAAALAGASVKRADDDLRRARAGLRSAYADLVSAQTREAEFLRTGDRLRELAQVLARREAAGEAAGYDRLRAEREVLDLEAEWSLARADRARAQAGLAAFFANPGDVTSLVVTVPEPARRPPPSVDDLVARAVVVLGEPAALRDEIGSARFAERAAERRLVPEPEIVAGTKSSTFGGGDLGSVVGVHLTLPIFDRGRPERALAEARRKQAEARLDVFHVTLRAQIAALRAIVLERQEEAARYRASTAASEGQLERIAQVSYETGERGILELLDAYRQGAAARTRQAMLDAAARQAEIDLELLSGWEVR